MSFEPGEISADELEKAAEKGKNKTTLTEEETKKINEIIQEAAKDAKSEGIKSATNAMQQKTLPIMKDLINRMVEDPTNASELNAVVDDIANKFLDGIDNFKDKDGLFHYPVEDGINTEAAEAGLKEFQENIRDRILSQIEDLVPPESFAGLKPNDKSVNVPVNPEPQYEAAGRIADGATPEAEEQFQRNQRDAAARRAESGDLNPSSYEGRNISFKDFLRLVALLVQIGGLGFFAWFIVYNAMVHSGCQQISCDENDTFPVATPVLCYGGGTGVPPFNGAIGYTATACTCDSTSKSLKCDQDNCNNDNKDNLRPWIDGCSPGTEDKCLNEDQLTCPFVKYRYQVFDPAGAFLNTVAAAADGANKEGGDFLDGLIKLAIWIGSIIGVLLVLYIIYKVVSNRGSSETVKIVSAPPVTNTSTSKFGRYLGDLSRYSNYGLMGRCGTYGLIPM